MVFRLVIRLFYDAVSIAELMYHPIRCGRMTVNDESERM
jgi:hypothetical protein